MQIDRTDEGGLAFRLSDRELQSFGLQWDTLDMQNPAARRLVRALLQFTQSNPAADGQSFLVEALPLEGGCLLLVTPQPPADESDTPTVFFTASFDSLLPVGAVCADRLPALHSSSLYRTADGFWLIWYGQPPAVITEFLQPMGVGAVAAAAVAEHAVPVRVADAVPYLAALAP